MAGIKKRHSSEISGSSSEDILFDEIENVDFNSQKKPKESIVAPVDKKENLEHIKELVPSVFKENKTQCLVHTVIENLSEIEDSNNNMDYMLQVQKIDNQIKFASILTNIEQKSVEMYSSEYRSHYKENFIEIELLGSGAFGKVYMAKHKITEKQYAIKKIISHKKKEIQYAIKEVQTLAKLDHPNVIEYKTAWIEPLIEHELQSSQSSQSSNEDSSTNGVNNDMKICKLSSSPEDISENESIQDSLNLKSGQKYIMYIQMSLSSMSLRKWMYDRSRQPSDELDIRNIVKQILSGLAHIHDKKIIHHDINPNNILITLKSDKIDKVQIADFGLARYLLKKSCSDIGGTCPYCAPEQFQNKSDSKSDIYSFGIILFELLYPMETLWELMEELKSLKKGNNLPPSIVNNYPGWDDILAKSIQEKPEMRSSAENLLNIINKNMSKEIRQCLPGCCCQRI